MALGRLLYWGNIGMMEKKMEATIGYLGYIENMALGIIQILSTSGGLYLIPLSRI